MKIQAILSFLFFSFFLSAQESTPGGKVVMNFKGFELGYSYPYFTKHKGTYNLIESHFNGGVKGGMTWGRQYKSGLAVAFTPSASLCYVGKTVFQSKFSGVGPKRHSILYRNFSIYLPVSIEVPFLFRSRLKGNVFLALPLESSGFINGREIKLTLFEDIGQKDFNSPDRPEFRSGFMVQFLLPLIIREDHHHFLSFEFMYFGNSNHQTSARERWVTLSYLRRNIFQKEKREKWDRYLMGKE
jgi:hypothetical protein